MAEYYSENARLKADEIAWMNEHIRNWQVVGGRSGWYRIEKDYDGYWVQRAGPYRTRDAARDAYLNNPIEEPMDRTRLNRPDIAFGQTDWYIVSETTDGQWAQLAGPFSSRDGARRWIWEHFPTTC
jgi:hypothetical protein